MTGWFAVLAVILAAANPPALAGPGPAGGRVRLRGVAVGLGVVAVIALGAEAIVDALSVSVPTFRTAAGAVIGIGGAVEVIRRRSVHPDSPAAGETADAVVDDESLLGGVLATLMPPVVFAAVAMAAEDAWWLTAVALGVSVAATAGFAASPPPVRLSARVAFGGLAVGVGVLLVSAGIRAI